MFIHGQYRTQCFKCQAFKDNSIGRFIAVKYLMLNDFFNLILGIALMAHFFHSFCVFFTQH